MDRFVLFPTRAPPLCSFASRFLIAAVSTLTGMNIVQIHGFVHLSLLIYAHISFCRAQQTFFPSSVPLVFRSPYFYAYIATQNDTIHSNVWPRLAGPIASLGWTGLVKVDNATTYLWSGDTGSVPGTIDTVLKQFTVTPTRTIFTLEAGPLELNVTYLSPIEPDDFVRQSIPFSYLTFEARSTDGLLHQVQVYSGVTDEWLDPDHSQNHSWATTLTRNGNQIHSFSYLTPHEFNELDGMASWGTPYYATKRETGVTHRIGFTQPGTALFVAQGFLDNSVDPNAPRIIQGGNISFTSLTFAHDLGTIESTSAPVVWAFGRTLDAATTSAIHFSTSAAQYQDLSGAPPQRRSLYYVTQYSDDTVLIDDFLNDFPAALERAIKFDANLTSAAASRIPGPEYSDLLSLATRQALGLTLLTVGKGSDGSWNESDVMMFWRDLGNGPPEQANPPDGLYSSFPMFLYLNPSLGAPLLEPLLRFQASPAYTTPYAAANIGTSWPNMTASNSLHNHGTEQSANMIILSYAQARAAGDTFLVGQYYQLLKSWADYLLTPTVSVFNNGQTSADGLTTANQTNLALKGIIAIKAMSMIANLTGNTADATTYSDKSRDLYTQWKSHALAEDGHMLLAYGDDSSSFSLGYNVFADLWLDTGVVDSDVTHGLSRQVNNLPSNSTKYGVPIDSTATDRVQSAWNMFIAAAVNDSTTRSKIIRQVHARVSLNTTDDQLYPLAWNSINLTTVSGNASPRQGAVFAPLVLSGAVAETTAPATPPSSGVKSTSKRPPTAAIAGGVAGGVLGSVMLVGLVYFLLRRHRRRTSLHEKPSPETTYQTDPFIIQDGHLQNTMAGASAALTTPTNAALSPKALVELRRATHAAGIRPASPVTVDPVPQDTEPAPVVPTPDRADVVSERSADARIEALRREVQALRQRVEPPPSYVDRDGR